MLVGECLCVVGEWMCWVGEWVDGCMDAIKWHVYQWWFITNVKGQGQCCSLSSYIRSEVSILSCSIH
jgi:hypothetical protein